MSRLNKLNDPVSLMISKKGIVSGVESECIRPVQILLFWDLESGSGLGFALKSLPEWNSREALG